MIKIVNKEWEKWEELKKKFNEEVVTMEEYNEIIELDSILIKDNGNNYNYWTNEHSVSFTAVFVNEEGEETDKFDFYNCEYEGDEEE